MRTKTLAHALLACLLLASVAAISPAQAEEPFSIGFEAPKETSNPYRSYMIVINDGGTYHLGTVYTGLVVGAHSSVSFTDSPLLSLASEGDGDDTRPTASLDTTPLTPSGFAPLRLTIVDIPAEAEVAAVEIRDSALGTTQTVNFHGENGEIIDDRGGNITVVVSGLWVIPDRSYEVALVTRSALFLESTMQLLTTNEAASNALHSATETLDGATEPLYTSAGTRGGYTPSDSSSSRGCYPATRWSWQRTLSTGSNFGNTRSANDHDLLKRANEITYHYGDGCYSSSNRSPTMDFGYGIHGAGIRVGTGLWTIFSALDYNGARNIEWRQVGGNYESKGHSIVVDDVHLTMRLPTEVGGTYSATANPKQASFSCSQVLPAWLDWSLGLVDQTGIISGVIPDKACSQKWSDHYIQKHSSGPAGGYISHIGSDGAEKHLGAYMTYHFSQYGLWIMDMETNARAYADMRACYGSCGWVSSNKDFWTWHTRTNEVRIPNP